MADFQNVFEILFLKEAKKAFLGTFWKFLRKSCSSLKISTYWRRRRL